MTKISITKPHVVIVEGTDEEWFFIEYLKFRNIENIQIINSRGVSNLHNYFKQVCLSEEFIRKNIVSISIIRDADNDPINNTISIQSFFSNSGIRGNISHNTLIRCNYPNSSDTLFCGFFIVPGNGRPGYLETLLLEFIESQNNNECINNFFDCLEANEIEIPPNRDKSRVQTFISVHPVGVRLVGEAASAGVWDFSHPSFAEILQFLEDQSRLE